MNAEESYDPVVPMNVENQRELESTGGKGRTTGRPE
jgi:hypothetical protein